MRPAVIATLLALTGCSGSAPTILVDDPPASATPLPTTAQPIEVDAGDAPDASADVAVPDVFDAGVPDGSALIIDAAATVDAASDAVDAGDSATAPDAPRDAATEASVEACEVACDSAAAACLIPCGAAGLCQSACRATNTTCHTQCSEVGDV